MKKRQRVSPPARKGGYEILYYNDDARDGWEELAEARPSRLRAAWDAIDEDPVPVLETQRQHRLKHKLGEILVGGQKREQWQFEVTAGGRIGYAVDREKRKVWITFASTKHPVATE